MSVDLKALGLTRDERLSLAYAYGFLSQMRARIAPMPVPPEHDLAIATLDKLLGNDAPVVRAAADPNTCPTCGLMFCDPSDRRDGSVLCWGHDQEAS